MVTGQGQGIVVATGLETELGRISAMLRAVETLTTPLIRQINSFARYLTFVILGISSVVFALAVWLRSYPWADAFMTVVGLAVAAIPEGLPAVMTITLAIGVQRMAARHAIVRQLPAVETLGSVSVICSDKTGTLTRNEMTVRTVVTKAGFYRGDWNWLRAARGIPARRPRDRQRGGSASQRTRAGSVALQRCDTTPN